MPVRYSDMGCSEEGRTAYRRLLVLLEIIVYKAHDERRLLKLAWPKPMQLIRIAYLSNCSFSEQDQLDAAARLGLCGSSRVGHYEARECEQVSPSRAAKDGVD